jgi:peptidoglycan/xylan/chitin deacetylase (PgdA/CDA1 family)
VSPRLPDRRQVRRAIPRPLRHLLYDRSRSRRRRWKLVPGVERVSGDVVTLTFDDGPDQRGTPEVLAALEALDVKATFFVLGSHVSEQPELTREIRDRGHDVALHGMTHRRHDGLSPAEAKAELAEGLAAIEAVLGERPRWYRPPFGRSSPALADACRELDLEIIYWTSWGFDWEPISAAAIARTVQRDLGAGTIVLLHDSARYAEREETAATAASLPAIVGAARDAGLNPQPLRTAIGVTS